MDDFNDPNSPPHLPRSGKAIDPRMIGAWKIGRTIGKGSSGRVKIARHSKTGQYAAVKIISKTSILNSRISLRDIDQGTDRILLNIEREIVIMKLIDHPNIMHLYDVWETSGELYLILEYVEGGELFDYLCEKGRLPASEALDYFQQIIGAVDYCHRFNVAHRDLKPENLLMDKQRNIKIADFGMAAWQGPDANKMLETSCGSPHYAAPEVVMGYSYNGFSSDIWSCGVILFALLAGRLPFDDEDITMLLDKVKLGKYMMPKDIDADAQDLISKMLEKNVKKRITMQGILAHPWFNSQPPRHPSCTAAALDEIARPVASASQIDSDLFKNLKTIWHNAPDEDIVAGLLSEKQTWEKGVYHLLAKYRTKHLENYTEDERRKSKKKLKRKHAKTPLNTPHVPEDIQSKRKSNHPVQRTNPPSPIIRPDPPTPRSATQHNTSQYPAHASLAPPSAQWIQYARTPESSHTPLIVPPIDVPELQDEKVQQFFQQIVEHLNAMQAQSQTYAQSWASSTASPYLSASSNAGTSDQSVRLHTPEKQLGSQTARGRDGILQNYLAANDKTPNTTRTSSFKKKNRNLIGNLLGMREDRSQHPTLRSNDRQSHFDKENGPPNIVNNHSADRVAKKSSLRRNDGPPREVLVDKKVQIVLPSPTDSSTDRSHQQLTHTSPAVSDDSIISTSHSIPKRSWFGNLFKFKPSTFQLLSVYDSTTTRDQCRLLLSNFGVLVVLVNTERMGYLKCRFDEIRDPTGIMAVAKAVQFRVEIYHTTDSQRQSGYSSCAMLVQEKGANSTFKLICERLEREWEMTAPRIQLDSLEQTNSKFTELAISS